MSLSPISEALANTAPAAGSTSSMVAQFAPLLLLLVVFYFLLIRPQQKRAKETKQMIDALKVGDEVVTAGGLFGRIAELGEHHLMVEVSKGTSLRFQRSAVQQVLPTGTLSHL